MILDQTLTSLELLEGLGDITYTSYAAGRAGHAFWPKLEIRLETPWVHNPEHPAYQPQAQQIAEESAETLEHAVSTLLANLREDVLEAMSEYRRMQHELECVLQERDAAREALQKARRDVAALGWYHENRIRQIRMGYEAQGQQKDGW